MTTSIPLSEKESRNPTPWQSATWEWEGIGHSEVNQLFTLLIGIWFMAHHYDGCCKKD